MPSAGPSLHGWIAPALRLALEERGTTAHRLATLPEGWAERLGEDVLLSWQSPAALARLQAGWSEWSAAAGWSARRVFGRFVPRQNAERVSPALLSGPGELPPSGEAREEGVRYGLDFSAGYSAGLFMDQRANRRRLRRLAPARLLNTFAYTCAFSVVGALAGARTFNLDLSRKSLQRGEENFRLNGLDPAAHSFLADDVLEVLPRLARRGEKFEAIILDPPTFSRGAGGRKWQVEQDLEKLIALGLEVAAPGAALLLSTNCARLARPELERAARFCLKAARRHGTLSAEDDLPDFPPGAGARTLWLHLHP